MALFGRLPGPIAAVSGFAAAGDMASLADELIDITVDGGGLHRYGDKILKIVHGLPQPLLEGLVLDLVQRRDAVAEPELRARLSDLVLDAAHQLSRDVSPTVAEAVLATAARFWIHQPGHQLMVSGKALIRAGRTLTDEAVAVIRRTSRDYATKDLAAFAASLTEPPLNCGEAWADRVNADVSALGAPWRALLDHAARATSARPSARWEQRGRDLLAALGEPAAGERLHDWLAPVGKPRTRPLERLRHDIDASDMFDPCNTDPLRGLIWLTALLPERPGTARLLGGLVETSLRRVAGIGPRSPKVANAAVYALSRLRSDAALGQLARLATGVTLKGTLKELNAALDARAVALGLDRDEIEELAVPTYGLVDVGRRVDVFGEASAELTVVGGSTTATWRAASGRVVKSVPAAVRAGHAEQLKEFQAAAKDIDKMLTAQSERLDRQILARRSWPFAPWRERYLDHPLVGTLARRLIWLVGDEPCGYLDGALCGPDDKPIDPAPDAAVRLWHPIGRELDEVIAWRAWLERHRVTQPFKQAHREVYLLTPAEEQTGVYSNRFAGHVLRQHQFHALAAIRGWHDRLRMMVDDDFPPPTRELPQWDLRVEFWVDGIGDEWDTDTNDSGAYLRITTDQVRFYRMNAASADPLPLTGIPPLVLSEALRDVDLFVGVASVGNDPTWQDGGPGGRFREYWASYSFGELNATAQTRRELLTRLVPRLAIADRATVESRFLVVRGDLRTYRIHLGSGNVLMSPHNQYLCIVPNRGAERGTDGVFLPFEGDRMLAVILSKALLLAGDSRITDRSITEQLRR
ncbi:hypothetical protein Val02_30150 [Virgisporangium aliadipatigenens]|uniref:DUF4132 domain-containing protein n=1 Tax=Virgisporangium aliadipatigenens TaxID=741659 RepID=A0A8J3YIV8_9ACTN|nr:DUF4132 domain-containing protein [Virgisporangium aliadipatigenens]GIJ46129.1 hypothetical protein Val02_30150 [Virgisporangium aliadipatigenens]